MTILLIAATCVAIVTLLVHTIAGSGAVVVPLLENRTLTPASRWLNYYCWHLTTLLIAVIGCGFGWLATGPLNADRWVVLAALCMACTLSGLWSVVVARMGRINPFRFPSTSLFLTLAALGWLALWAGT